MRNHHWLDDLGAALADSVPRRTVFGVASTLATALLGHAIGQPISARSGGKGVRKKAKKKPNSAKKPSPSPARCGASACAAQWPNDTVNRDACELKCGRCRIREKFCIIEGDPNDTAKIATCCYEDQTCCNGECVDLKTDRAHCGACGKRCGFAETCADSQCVSQCGPGGSPCPGSLETCCRAGKTCCNGRCIDTVGDDNNCGECGKRCRKPGYPRNELCIAGECVCWADGTVWDESCNGCNNPATWKCCDAGGSACLVTHDCVMLGTRPNGDPIWGCVGRPQLSG